MSTGQCKHIDNGILRTFLPRYPSLTFTAQVGLPRLCEMSYMRWQKPREVCVGSSRPVSPVEGRRVSLGLAAEHHLSSILSRMKWEHHTAGLFGERGPQQDFTSCTDKQQNSISFDVAVSLETNFHFFFFFSSFFSLFATVQWISKASGEENVEEEAKCKTVQMKRNFRRHKNRCLAHIHQ